MNVALHRLVYADNLLCLRCLNTKHPSKDHLIEASQSSMWGYFAPLPTILSSRICGWSLV